MDSRTPLQRPAEDFDVLQDQLLRELERIEEKPVSEASRQSAVSGASYEAYLRQAMAMARQQVAEGNAEGPREVLDRLITAQGFVEKHLPEKTSPAAEAAREIHCAIRSLYLADDALERTRVQEKRISEANRPRSARSCASCDSTGISTWCGVRSISC